MTVEIKLNEKEFKRLMQFVFLGNYVINGIRGEKEQIEAYNRLERKLTRLQYEVYKNIPGREAEENELTDFHDWAIDAVEGYLKDFERDIFLEKLAKWITWENYPIIPGDRESLEKHWAAETEYRKIVKEQGIQFAKVSAPKIDDKLNIDNIDEK